MPELEMQFGYYTVIVAIFTLCGILFWRFRKNDRYNWDPCRAAAEDVVACEEPPDCPNRASPQRTFPNGKKPPEIASE
jgi:hypothetical protein